MQNRTEILCTSPNRRRNIYENFITVRKKWRLVQLVAGVLAGSLCQKLHALHGVARVVTLPRSIIVQKLT